MIESEKFHGNDGIMVQGRPEQSGLLTIWPIAAIPVSAPKPLLGSSVE